MEAAITEAVRTEGELIKAETDQGTSRGLRVRRRGKQASSRKERDGAPQNTAYKAEPE